MTRYLSTLLICLTIAGSAICQDQLNTKKYGFKMDIPSGFEFDTYEDGNFGGLEGYELESDTYVSAYAYKGEATKNEIYQFGIDQTSIPESYWKTVGEGKNENGFKWWEVYKAKYDGKLLYAILGKNATKEIYYLFFVLAPEESFELFEEDYMNWIESCQGI